eukprot:1326964-Prymnesium_polylepis.1
MGPSGTVRMLIQSHCARASGRRGVENVDRRSHEHFDGLELRIWRPTFFFRMTPTTLQVYLLVLGRTTLGFADFRSIYSVSCKTQKSFTDTRLGPSGSVRMLTLVRG